LRGFQQVGYLLIQLAADATIQPAGQAVVILLRSNAES
jgi:hypothetical protein